MRLSLIIAVLTATVIASQAVDGRPEELLAEPLESIPLEVGDWRGEADPRLREDIQSSLGASSYLSRTYRRGSDTVQLFIAYYANQRAGESMHSPKHCLPGSGWEILSYGETTLPGGPENVRVNQDTIQKDGLRMQVLYWYQSRRRVVADEYRAKLYLIRDAVLERRAGGAIVRITHPADQKGVRLGLDFAAAIFPALQRSIGTREGSGPAGESAKARDIGADRQE